MFSVRMSSSDQRKLTNRIAVLSKNRALRTKSIKLAQNRSLECLLPNKKWYTNWSKSLYCVSLL